MRCGVSLSVVPESEKAVERACAEAAAALEGLSCDLALLFVSPHHREKIEEIARAVRRRLRPGVLLGCTAGGVIGGEREIENRPGLTLWAAHLPGVRVVPFHLRYDEESEEVKGWPEALPPKEERPAFLLLPDPFTVPMEPVLDRINESYPGSSLIGGMASGAPMPGQNRLLVDKEVFEEGAVGAALSGRVRVRTVVSQGCRPIGKPFVVTQGEKNVILALGGKPALKQLQELFASLPPADQQLFRRGVHVGRAVNEMQERFGRGDFLVRNVIGIDPESGAIAIGDFVRKGSTVQFHVRDADSAREDLLQLLDEERKKADGPPAGALLFSCNGRGVHLFGEPNRDIGALREMLGLVPVAGFFAQGEIGPIGGKNFLHGFTASIALFSAPR